jgi:hypothetical protein
MAQQDWAPSKAMQCHLQSLMNQGFMMATELAACRMPEDLTFRAPAEGYVVTLVAFCE